MPDACVCATCESASLHSTRRPLYRVKSFLGVRSMEAASRHPRSPLAILLRAASPSPALAQETPAAQSRPRRHHPRHADRHRHPRQPTAPWPNRPRRSTSSPPRCCSPPAPPNWPPRCRAPCLRSISRGRRSPTAPTRCARRSCAASSPDQVLVLVNGKRYHTAALVNLNGTPGPRFVAGRPQHHSDRRRSNASRCCATAPRRSTVPTRSPA